MNIKITRKLHIGGEIKSPGWEILNVVPGPHVDHVSNAKDLSRFADATFTDIYASHILEHFDYREELTLTLKEWNRILRPGGRLYISVPDLDILAQLFILKDRFNIVERIHIMKMIFGAHQDEYDYHQVGLNQDFLSYFLTESGFTNLRRVSNFDLFKDSSCLTFHGVPISLNMLAEKPL